MVKTSHYGILFVFKEDDDSWFDLEANDNQCEEGHRHGLKSSGFQKENRNEFAEKEQRKVIMLT